MSLGHPLFLVVYHSVTLESATAEAQMDDLLAALSHFGHPCVFLMPNADTGGRIIFQKIMQFVDNNPSSKAFVNLERSLYLDLMRRADVMVGNSSSGIVEATSFGTPVVNIGDRQRGRVRAKNVIDCSNEAESIIGAIQNALDPDFKQSLLELINPYGGDSTARRIVDILEHVELGQELLKKQFYDLRQSDQDITAKVPGG